MSSDDWPTSTTDLPRPPPSLVFFSHPRNERPCREWMYVFLNDPETGIVSTGIQVPYGCVTNTSVGHPFTYVVRPPFLPASGFPGCVRRMHACMNVTLRVPPFLFYKPQIRSVRLSWKKVKRSLFARSRPNPASLMSPSITDACLLLALPSPAGCPTGDRRYQRKTARERNDEDI